MACLILGNSEIVLSLGRCIRLRKSNQDLLETLDALFKVVLIEFCLALAKKELGDKILWRQKSDKPVVLITI